MVVSEDTRTCGFASEIISRITEIPEVFESLDAYPMRVVKPDTLVPYSPILEKAALPHAPRILEAIKTLAAY